MSTRSYRTSFLSIVVILLLIGNTAFSQQRNVRKSTQPENTQPVKTSTSTNNSQVVSRSGSNTLDYKVISSTASYIEIEFYPVFHKPQQVKYNNQTYSVLSFDLSAGKDIKEAGQPDIKWRIFPLIFPSTDGNTVSVIDYDENDVNNFDLAPVPGVTFVDPHKRGFDNITTTYIKDSKYYSQNKFFPSSIVAVSNIGAVRNMLVGSLLIYPCQYNPATKVLKEYTRIRVRVNFGRNPVFITKKRSRAEEELLNGIGLNSKIALNWMNPQLVNQNNIESVSNSVLSTGDWYKIEIRDNGSGNSEGIYKITKSFLESAGINLSNVDPRTIKMYGNGGYMLSSYVSDPRPEDLDQIAIYIQGEANGHFDDGDYILFYARSINNWNYDNATHTNHHYIDYYSNSNYYWIQFNTPGMGKRMTVEQSINIQNPIIPPSFTEKLFYEPEVNNLIAEGNLWLSQRIGSGEAFTWNNTLTGLLPNSEILYRIKPASRVFCGYNNSFVLQEVNSIVSPVTHNMGCIVAGYGPWIFTDTAEFSINSSQKTNGNQSSFKATFYADDPSAEGYLDWMEIQYQRTYNSVVNDFLEFDAPDETGTLEFNVSPFSSNQIRVFDATIHDNVNIVQPISVSASNVRFQKNQDLILSKFLVVGPNGYKTPSSITQRIPNQNLRGGYTDGANLIIITPKVFMQAANRLKTRNESGGPSNPSYLKTDIFDIQAIYNEFSGGVVDAVAIRDFLKYCYDHWQTPPEYVCFLGSGSFDYKNLENLPPENYANWIPAFEYTDSQIDQVATYTSDDFYVEFSPVYSNPYMAHGRIPAKTLQDANNYLDKLDCYTDPSYNGYWKNRAIFCADDGIVPGGNEGSQHTDQCEDLAENHTLPTLDKTKIYLVMYPTVITSQGRRKPGATKDIISNWNEGALSINWTGHGSPDLWSHNYVFEKDVVVSQLNNQCKYPFLSVASCEFNKFDDPQDQSAGELLAVKALKGTIGTLAATRPVYGGTNSVFNNSFWSTLYTNMDTLLLQTRFSKAIFLTKQSLNSVNDLKWELLCDPTLRVQYPRFKSRVDSIIGLSSDTMRALSHVKIYGSIIHPDSSFWNDYNGKIYMKIFDVTRQITMADEQGFLYTFKLPGGIIYSGTQNISNGRWLIQFIVPKDISYLNQNGKMINYFYNSQSDGSSLYTNFIVGGIDPNAAIDTTGPDISLYLNTRNFRTGDVVNQNFKLIADLYDASGINTTGTIGHKIEATLDNNDNNKYDLTNYYNSDSSYQSGSLQYDFSSIPDGHHTLMLRAWDTYNNSSEKEIDFIVASSNALEITNVFNYPNQFKDKTSFTFQHNFPNPINVKIDIYTVAGRLIKQIQQSSITDKFVAIPWDGKDQDGETLANGIYIYKLLVDGGQGTQTITNIGKLAVLK
jgi:hypothetical protein